MNLLSPSNSLSPHTPTYCLLCPAPAVVMPLSLLCTSCSDSDTVTQEQQEPEPGLWGHWQHYWAWSLRQLITSLPQPWSVSTSRSAMTQQAAYWKWSKLMNGIEMTYHQVMAPNPLMWRDLTKKDVFNKFNLRKLKFSFHKCLNPLRHAPNPPQGSVQGNT